MNYRTTGRKTPLPINLASIALGFVIFLAGCVSHVTFPSAAARNVELTGHLYRPDGNGPFPAMVLLHACGGLSNHVLGWASWLKDEGYVALAIDSLRPRGTRDVCGSPLNPSISDVLQDAFGALAYLRSLPFVDPGRIGVIGWSYGATAALWANFSGRPGKEFQATVAFYPGCSQMPDDTSTPLLLLLGEAG